MERILLAEAGMEAAALRAAAVLRKGGVVLYPTDTLYGLGADALSDAAVAKVRRIKGRDEGKPIHAVVADSAMAERYAEFNDAARALAKSFWPGAFTLVLKKKSEVETGIARGIDTIGLRIPENEFCLALAREFGKPYTTTSANISGEEPETTVEGILQQLGHSNILKNVGMLVIDAGELPKRGVSTVVDVSSGRAVVLREGAIPARDILALAA